MTIKIFKMILTKIKAAVVFKVLGRMQQKQFMFDNIFPRGRDDKRVRFKMAPRLFKGRQEYEQRFLWRAQPWQSSQRSYTDFTEIHFQLKWLRRTLPENIILSTFPKIGQQAFLPLKG